ncbi:hypothetical protein ABB37_04052 [Leptomonas pyrrhocoris]|uniref:Uncharacterized protein n=1 Tax=Leptomonas pyrrhocoris TaxID=157538 RepID=A0A0N0VFS2_LEPPY|nr:hypothetical protein ABB37_04052 [Leptomonas pyrrhocoris]XP_015660211.1 hypothetical protein ABB37_04052 [Leptomonas pyrrhocoris]KPA81771.1 hypothetical protein ABB37_04052 [Leptomonas pyrrhocoris]KPA81772.1 hypothetical protein ABB37_04052 [Leptomonas pyrrhocoris]|eukprot:XP_015660210.1 hypothetical protein ABB37_04052 [Leptomonas pyrrhocoris]
MAYIHNGRVVEKKPFTLRGFLLALYSALSLFLRTFVSLQPMSQAIEEHQHPTPGATNGGWRSSLQGLLSRGRGQALGGGGDNRRGSGGGGSSWADAVNRRGGNIHSLPKPPIGGGCAGGG